MAVRNVILSGFLAWGTAASGFGEPAAAGANPSLDESVSVTAAEIKLPGVTLDRKTLEVRIDATVCLDSGVLEFVVCKPHTFEHESIFTTEAKPELVHAALLLGGLKAAPQVAGLTEIWWQNALKKEDSRVKIEVEWVEQGVSKRVNLSSMLRHRSVREGGGVPDDTKNGQAEPEQVRDAWVFAGSYLQADPETGERFYAANSSGLLVGIWPDPSSVIQYGIANGNPYESKGFGMEIHEQRVPEVGTPVKLVFSRLIPMRKSPPPKPTKQ